MAITFINKETGEKMMHYDVEAYKAMMPRPKKHKVSRKKGKKKSK